MAPTSRRQTTVRGTVVIVTVAVLMALVGPATALRHADTGVTPTSNTESVLPVSERFAWGVSSSAFQTEGGKLPSNWHQYADDGPGGNEPYRNSVDFRHRYRGDIRRAAELGVKVYRIGINWARIEPHEGQINWRGLQYYDDVIRTIRRHGMQPLITLDHFVYPLWVLEQDAWDNPKTVDDFIAYSRLIARRYGNQVGRWLVFNEPFCYVAIEAGARDMTPVQIAVMYDHLVQAHRRAYDVIHHSRRTAQVSSNLCTPSLAPAARYAADALFIDRVVDKIDYIGIDYYYRDAGIEFLMSLADGEIWNVPLDPEGIYHVLLDYHRRYPHLPIVITENGMSTDDGKPRSDGWTRAGYLRDVVYWMQRAIGAGVPVRGYYYWSITDNYEWGSYRPRFGLYRVDVNTDPDLVRHPTPAVRTYRTLIARGGVTSNYTPPSRPH